MARGYPDFWGGKADVILRAEWAAKEGTDKTFYVSPADTAPGSYQILSYTVPTGKVLYIAQVSVFGRATTASDRDLNQNVAGDIERYSPSAVFWSQGGFGGCGATFPKPIVIASGELVIFAALNQSNHNMMVGGSALGYEV